MDVDAIRDDLADAKPRFAYYSLHRDYWAGRHRYPFASPKFVNMYRWILRTAQMNVCEPIVDAFTDRITVDNWGMTDEKTSQELDRARALIDREAWRCGDAYVLVWPGKDGRRHPYYHRADQIIPHIDETDPTAMAWATKLWTARDGHGRLTVYDAQKAERWETDHKITEPGTSATIDDWTTELAHMHPYRADGSEVIGHDMGVTPVCWWRRGGDDQIGFGRSILEAVIPIQDELNYSVAASIIGIERIAEPIRYALADEAPKPRLNPLTGRMEPPSVDFDPTKENLLTLVARQAGQFSSPSAADLIALQNQAARKAGSVVGVPAWYLAEDSDGQAPSGESLRVEMSRMIAKIVAYEAESAPVDRGLMELLGYTDAQPTYADPQPPSMAEKMAIAQAKRQLGYSLGDAIAGLGEADPDGIVARAQAERAQTDAAAGRALMNGQIEF